VTVVDAKKYKVLKNLTIPGEGAKPMGTAMAPDGDHLYITTGRGGTAVVIDTKNDSVGTPFPVGKRPWGISVSADGKWVYTANGPSNDISVIDASTNQVVKHIPGGKSPWGIAISK
jgi:YVTN family beta-propeller protein